MGVSASGEPVEEVERGTAGEVGRRRVRREDYRLVTGQATYTDDFQSPGQLHAAVHRSQYGHADIEAVDSADAEDHPAVAAVFTAADLAEADVRNGYRIEGALPEQKGTTQPLLAEDRVRYAGEPIAIVVAEDRYAAHEAADAIDVAYDRRDAVTDVRSALAADAPVLHAEHGDNEALDWSFGDEAATDEAFAAADRVIELSPANQRLVPNAMEPRAVHATVDPSTDRLTVRLSTQVPHRARARFAEVLPVPETQLRVIAPDVGGGFGSKGGSPYPEEPLVAWAALQLGRPVSWIATRTESFQADHHGRDVETDAALAIDDDGEIRGLRVDAAFNLGAYLAWGPTPAAVYRVLLSGEYVVPAIHGEVTAAFTNTAPIAPYRGAGRPEAIFVVERLLKRAATVLGLDPVALRRRNLIDPDAFPFETAHGVVYDSGDYERALDVALEAVDYDGWRARQAEGREAGRHLGIGVGSFVENTGPAPGRPEYGRVRIEGDGTVVAHCGTADHGQGHATTFSQVLADELGIDYEAIEVIEGDTADLPEGVGTFGSRSAPVGASALVTCAREVIEGATAVAAEALSVSADSVDFDDGVFAVVGDPATSIEIDEVARLAHADDGPGQPSALEASGSFDPESFAFAFGTHIAVVAVDPESGEVDLLDYAAVDDVGTQFNPRIVEGQVHGGAVQGIGQALYEDTVYDETGTLVTGSFQDYALPRAAHVPELTVEETETPAPHNPTGAKGAGEGGAIAAPPAVVNAVVDALEPFGVVDVPMPVTPERVWRAVRDAPDP